MDGYIDRLFNLRGKTAVVTGGGGHLCGCMALGFAKAGMSVAVLDIRLEKAENVADKIGARGGKAIPIQMDVRIKHDFEKALERILNEFGQVDVLVNGAGMNAPTPVLDISPDEWHQIMTVNLTGTLYGCQVFGAYMVKNKKGSIINMSSASANPPLSKAFTYSVSKAGVRNLTQNLGREWAQAGVRVNALRPGFFPTEWSRKHFIDEDRERAILAHTPMARYGEPEELLGAVLWLASEASGFVTGAEVHVDGGYAAMTI